MKASPAIRSVLLALALVVLVPTAYAQTTPDTTAGTVVENDDDGDSGLWGLLGLIGLAGLIPRKHRVETHDTTRRT